MEWHKIRNDYLSDEKREKIEEKAKSHPRLKHAVHVFHKNTFYELFKRWVFPGPLVFVLRMILFSIWDYFLLSLLQRLIFIGYSDWEKPAGIRRKISIWVTVVFIRINLFLAGFYWIECIDYTKNRPFSKKAEDLPRFEWGQPWVMVAPHAGPLDLKIAWTVFGAPSSLISDEADTIHGMKFLHKAFRDIVVYKVRKNMPGSSQRLQQRQDAEGDYSVFACPEGCYTCGTGIFRFHAGVFNAGKPVRPVVITYPSRCKHLSPRNFPILKWWYDMYTQFCNRVRVEILDLYVPDEAEKADPQLYADHVGQLIAGKMNVPYLLDVGNPEACLVEELLRGRVQWAEVESKLKDIDVERERETGRRKNRKKEGIH